jgi:[NiFe] hydrogenase diaphorase moiety small subunit
MADTKKKNKKPILKNKKSSGKIKVKKTAILKIKSAAVPKVKNPVKSKSPNKAVTKTREKNKIKTKKPAKTALKAKTKSPKEKSAGSTAKVKLSAKSVKPVNKSIKATVKPKTKTKAKKMTPVIKTKSSARKGGKSAKIEFSIDGVDCTAINGQSIVEAAGDNGIYIPVLCFYKGMKPAGICRMCTVRVNGRFMAACTTPVAHGMIIENDIAEIQNMRKAIVEMLFVEGNHLCPTCEKSGNCELQALGYRYKMIVPRFPYQFPGRKIDASYTKIMIDNNRCVHCRRCIRGITAKDGKHIFAVTNRSGKSTIIADQELEKNMSEELAAKAMYQCPVGAILKKEVGFAVPIGNRKYDAALIGSEIEK